MIKGSDNFLRRLKYKYPTSRKIRFEFKNKVYESSLGFHNKLNFNEFIQNFFDENHKDLKAENFEITRENKFIEKSNLVNESCLKETFNIVTMEISRNEILKNEKKKKKGFEQGFEFSGNYEKNLPMHSNFFLYLSKTLDKKRYEIPEKFLEDKEKKIETSYNSPLSKELNTRFFYQMKKIPNSGYDQINKFVYGVYDKDYYKHFNFSLLNHFIEINKENMIHPLKVDIDYNLTGLLAPERQIDLMLRRLDNSFLLPISFANHVNDISNYKKFLQGHKIYSEENNNLKEKKMNQQIEDKLKNFKGNLGKK